MYYIGFCPVCGSGLGIRVCGQGHRVVFCDECYSSWFGPDLSDEPFQPPAPDKEPVCPYGDDTLFDGHWASKEEIEQQDWWDYVIGEGSSLFP